MSKKGGITKGKSHKEGGIPMVVESTGQQVELEGGEGVINKRNMASDTKFDFQGKQMTTCEIASAINSANGNGVQIDCDDVTGKKYAYEDGGVVFINYKKDEIMYAPIDGKYYANDMEFDTLEEAQRFLDSGGVNENLRGAYERGLFAEGGSVIKEYFEIQNPYDDNRKVFKTIKETKVNPINKDEIIIVFNDNNDYLVKKDDYETLLQNKFFNEFPKIPMYQYNELNKDEKQNWHNDFFSNYRQENWKIVKGTLMENPLGLYEGGGGVGNEYIALSKTKNGLLLSERFKKQITHKQLFDYYKKKGYEIIDSNIFKVTNKGVLDVLKDAISKFIKEKYNELVDWQNTLLSYEIVGDKIIAKSCFVQTKNGNEYKITPNDLVNKNFAKGGWLLINADTERIIKEYDTESEARQMSYEYDGDSMVIKKSELEKEKLRETYRPPAPLNPATYIMKKGGSVKDYNSLIGKYVNIYSMGVSLPTEHQIKDVQVSGENFRHRYVTLKFDLGIAPILLDEATAFMNNEIIYVNNNKEEFGIQLMPNQFKEGGDVPKANKMFHLPLELAVYVPSTQDVDKVISDSELDARVDEVSKYLATIFGGFTKSDKIGGFVSSQSELVTEEVVPVVSFATKQDYDANKNKLVTKLSEWARKWGQEAIGFEFEGDLYYVPQKFDKGGDVRDFSWYQDFKKQELKRGTEHEMEHVDSISKFKKKGVSDKEVAQAIAKDHLEEDENYYIELDKMESSRKLSEALNDFEKQRGYRKNSAKYNLGGSMMNAQELVHIKFTEDFNGVLRKKDGKYMSESMFLKGKIYKFTFLFNDGRNTALEFGNTGAYILAPNDIINVVGFNEGVYGDGGSIKAYQSINLDSNDKSILEMLRNIEDRNATSQQREKLSSFKGNNVVNDLSSKMIQKIYGILFKNHNLENKILNLYLSNIGVGNILLFAPSFLNKTMVSFDEHNPFSQVEKDIADIVTQGARAFLYNDFEMKSMDAIIHVYPKTNPETDTLCSYFYKTTKKAIALGVCEFTSKEKLDEFQQSIRVNQGSMSQNQMITFTKANEYFVINEGITDEGQYTLIYTMTKF